VPDSPLPPPPDAQACVSPEPSKVTSQVDGGVPSGHGQAAGSGIEVLESQSRPLESAKVPAAPPKDVLLLAHPTEDGRGVHVLRQRAQSLEVGIVRPLVSGKPIVGEVVRLEPRPEMPRLCDVHVEVTTPSPSSSRPTSKGPAQVASAAYRANWDAIWSRPKPSGDERPN